MTGRVFLHVGLPKSGTSYLQKLLTANRAALAGEAGLLFPGESWSEQVLAVRDVRNLFDPSMRKRVVGSWQRLVDEVTAWQGDAVVSMEWLCAAGDEQIDRIVGSFGEREVHVVFTARDLARTLPAAWQEFMQNRQTWTWEEFLAGVRDPDGTSTGGRAFWAQQHLPRLLERWCRHVEAGRVHLVTLPQPGADRDLLWQRFATLLGIDPGVCRTEGLGGNESLGLESAELMRRINLRLEELAVGRRPNPFFKHRLAKDVLAARRAEESTLSLSPEAQSWIGEVAERHIELVAGQQVEVVGDLAELRPTAPKAGRRPSDVSESELLEVAIDALVRLGVSSKAKPVDPTLPPSTTTSGPAAPDAPARSEDSAEGGLLARARRRLRDHG